MQIHYNLRIFISKSNANAKLESMKHYERLDKELKKGSLLRKVNVSGSALGEEGIYASDGTFLFSSKGFDEDAESITDTISYPPTLVFFGAGHVAYALYKEAKILGLDIVVFDDRDELLSKFKDARTTHNGFGDILKAKLEFDNPYYIIFTHGHVYDEMVLERVLTERSDYIGMIGSKKKIELTYQNLSRKGFSEKDFMRIHAPIGLSINAETPEEIAISILAEIIKTYRKEKKTIFLEKKIIEELKTLKERAILLTIIEKTGSGPRNKGAMMIVREDGEDFTIGGGNIERNAILDAREMLASGKGNACIKEYEMEAGSSLGMACGGSAHILFTPLSPT